MSNTTPKGFIIVLSGPGGVGKNTVRDGLLAALPTLTAIQKVTTRPPRPDEKANEFEFVSEHDFQKLIRAGALFEYTRFGGHSYGTPAAPLENALKAGRTVIMIYDLVGARNLKRRWPDQTVWIFLSASEADLRRRLAARGETPGRIEERLKIARQTEFPAAREADLMAENSEGHPERAVQTIVDFLKNR